MQGGRHRSLVERDDYLIGTHEAQLVAHHLVGEVRIGLARIEQSGTMPKLRLLDFELSELRFPHLQVVVIATPGKQAVRTRDRIAGKIADDDDRKRGPEDLAHMTECTITTHHEP